MCFFWRRQIWDRKYNKHDWGSIIYLHQGDAVFFFICLHQCNKIEDEYNLIK